MYPGESNEYTSSQVRPSGVNPLQKPLFGGSQQRGYGGTPDFQPSQPMQVQDQRVEYGVASNQYGRNNVSDYSNQPYQNYNHARSSTPQQQPVSAPPQKHKHVAFEQFLESDGENLVEGKNAYVKRERLKHSEVTDNIGPNLIRKPSNMYTVQQPTRPLHEPIRPGMNVRYEGILANDVEGNKVKPNMKKGLNIKFRNKVEVFNVESYKIYNADLSKEAKARRRKEAMEGGCLLV